jgi:phosphoglycerol transferase MdoB-like AlkP superfamily enzyme
MRTFVPILFLILLGVIGWRLLPRQGKRVAKRFVRAHILWLAGTALLLFILAAILSLVEVKLF